MAYNKNICTHCGKSMETWDKIIMILRKPNITSKTVGHFHPKCWDEIYPKMKVGTDE